MQKSPQMLRRFGVLLTIGAASALSTTGALERKVLQLAAQSSTGVEAAIDELVAAGGIEKPALSPQIEGEWKLVHISSSSFDAVSNAHTSRSAGGAHHLLMRARVHPVLNSQLR